MSSCAAFGCEKHSPFGISHHTVWWKKWKEKHRREGGELGALEVGTQVTVPKRHVRPVLSICRSAVRSGGGRGGAGGGGDCGAVRGLLPHGHGAVESRGLPRGELAGGRPRDGEDRQG